MLLAQIKFWLHYPQGLDYCCQGSHFRMGKSVQYVKKYTLGNLFSRATNFVNAHHSYGKNSAYVSGPSDVIISLAIKFWTKAK